MNKEENKWRAVFVLSNPCCDGCGSNLKVLEVEKYNSNFLILTVAPHNGYDKAYVIYDMRINKTIAGGTAVDKNGILELLAEGTDLFPKNYQMEQ